MAYVTCPSCMTPQLVGDEEDGYRCMTCFGDVRFHTCPNCNFDQTVSENWTSFTCGHCDAKVDLPHVRTFADTTRARRAQGVGHPWPRM